MSEDYLSKEETYELINFARQHGVNFHLVDVLNNLLEVNGHPDVIDELRDAIKYGV